MILKKKEDSRIKDPHALAVELIMGKNLWLTKIRWLYSLLIFLFFFIHKYIADKVYINFRSFILIMSLAILANLIFIFSLRKKLKKPLKKIEYKSLLSIISLQLDFDLVVLFLLVFFSGGFESPVIVLFILYVMLSTFLTDYKKAFRNTLASVVLIGVIFFKDESLISSTQKLTTMIGFNIILVFSFLISAYLSKNLRKNEGVLQELLKKTRELSITDGLTDLYNQSHFFELLDLELKKSEKHKLTFSLIMFDVDSFKTYNDHNGHIHGSRALNKIGVLMKKVFRFSDILAKYGGDEFVVILPQTDKIGAFLAADRLRETVEQEEFTGMEKQPQGKITLSIGIASYPAHGTSAEEILDRADKAMYYAKETGKNKTIIFSDDMGKAEK